MKSEWSSRGDWNNYQVLECFCWLIHATAIVAVISIVDSFNNRKKNINRAGNN
jgi:hypothetical protein